MATPIVRSRADHNISRKNIDPDAVKVLYRLNHAGYTAYLVGGGVRDLLLGHAPKDFDIATDAHPNDIKKLFRNARLIGRRFRLAHVVFGPKVIEVSTFRRKAEFESADEGDLLIRRDNTFGTPEEDAVRRDFTVNSLFYDISTFSLIDFVGGLEDIDQRLLRSIGDPDIRLREDPIRILRAVKFSARLGLTTEPMVRAAMIQHRWEIPKAAAPRIFEEILRMLRGGAARKSYQLLREYEIMEVILPRLERFLSSDEDSVFEERMRFWEVLETLDCLRAEGRELAPAVLLGCLVMPLVRQLAESRGLDASSPSTVEELLAPIAAEMNIPRREAERLRLMIALQARLARGPEGRGNRGLTGRATFGEALDLFEMFAMASGEHLELVPVWRQAAEHGPAPEELPAQRRRQRRPPRRGEREDGGEARSGRRPTAD